MTSRPGFRGRLGLLLFCIAAGGAIGFAGSTLGGSDYWYLAIPAAIALGWMFVADPSACGPSPDGRPRCGRDGPP